MQIVGLAAMWTLGFLALERGSRALLRRWPLGTRHLALAALGLGLAALGAGLGRWPGALGLILGLAAAPLGLALAALPFLWGSRDGSYGWHRGSLKRPDPARPLVLVADPHWEDSLTGLEAATARLPEADWLFLGDCFDLWVGVRGLERPAQEAFLAWVDARRAAGRWVGYWMGNHEFLLERHARRFDLLGEGTGACLAEGLSFEHGDLVNGRDWRYRVLNLVLRSGPVGLLVRILPAGPVAAWARGLEQRLRGAHRQRTRSFPMEAFQGAVGRAPGHFHVTGHFHEDVSVARGRSLPWAHAGGFALWQDGEVHLLS